MSYATKECYECGLRRPIYEMREKTIEIKSGRSSGSINFSSGTRKNSQRAGYSTGRSYYRNKTVYYCAHPDAHHDPDYFKNKAKQAKLREEAELMLSNSERESYKEVMVEVLNSNALQSVVIDFFVLSKDYINGNNRIEKINKKSKSSLVLLDIIKENINNFIFNSDIEEIVKTVLKNNNNTSGWKLINRKKIIALHSAWILPISTMFLAVYWKDHDHLGLIFNLLFMLSIVFSPVLIVYSLLKKNYYKALYRVLTNASKFISGIANELTLQILANRYGFELVENLDEYKKELIEHIVTSLDNGSLTKSKKNNILSNYSFNKYAQKLARIKMNSIDLKDALTKFENIKKLKADTKSDDKNINTSKSLLKELEIIFNGFVMSDNIHDQIVFLLAYIIIGSDGNISEKEIFILNELTELSDSEIVRIKKIHQALVLVFKNDKEIIDFILKYIIENQPNEEYRKSLVKNLFNVIVADNIIHGNEMSLLKHISNKILGNNDLFLELLNNFDI